MTTVRTAPALALLTFVTALAGCDDPLSTLPIEPTLAATVTETYPSPIFELNCDLWAQDCAPGAKCVGHDQGGLGEVFENTCVPILGEGQPGDPCSQYGDGLDDCGAESVCHHVDEYGVGTCFAQCQGGFTDLQCDDPSSTCVVANRGVLNLCLSACDPLIQDCGMNDVCVPKTDGAGFFCTPADYWEWPPELAECLSHEECGVGQFCADAESFPSEQVFELGAGVCTSFCDRNDPAACGAPGYLDLSCEGYWANDGGSAWLTFAGVGGCVEVPAY